VGKSIFTILESMAVATNKQLTFDAPRNGGGAVWMYNTEDPLDELDRRIIATAKHHGIAKDQMKDLFYSSGYQSPIKLAAYDSKSYSGSIVLNNPLIESLIKQIKDRGVQLFVVDPFVRCHSINENDNVAVDMVMQAFQIIAAEANCAIAINHHTNKGKELRGDIDKSRGATALVFAARIAHTLFSMTPKEAVEYAVRDSRLFITRDDAKANLSLGAFGSVRQMEDSVGFGGPVSMGQWFKKVSVEVGGRMLDDDGKEVEETTGALEMADLNRTVVRDVTEVLIEDAVLERVGIGEKMTTYALAKSIKSDGKLALIMTAKTLQSKIEDLFQFPYVRDEYTWHMFEDKGHDKLVKVIGCDVDVFC